MPEVSVGPSSFLLLLLQSARKGHPLILLLATLLLLQVLYMTLCVGVCVRGCVHVCVGVCVRGCVHVCLGVCTYMYVGVKRYLCMGECACVGVLVDMCTLTVRTECTVHYQYHQAVE